MDDMGRECMWARVGRQAVLDGVRLPDAEVCARDEEVVGHAEGGRVHDSPARHRYTLLLGMTTARKGGKMKERHERQNRGTCRD